MTDTTGFGIHLRMFLRRDRWMFLWWALGAILLYYSQAVSVKGLYATRAEFDRAAANMEQNTAFVAMAGPARALNTIGGQVVWQASAFGAIVAGLMSMFLIGRHTRAEEESGRDELLRASPVGRHASLIAALVNALLANLLLGILVAGSLATFPLAGIDSLAVGVGLMLCGWVFTGTALVAAQLTSSTRSMYGISGAVIALAYLLRAVGDVGIHALSWVSPIGWYQGMHPFSGLRWWPALLLLLTAGASVGTAYLLFERRDFGAGMSPNRPGPARADRGLSTALGLAWRLQRGAVLGWCLGLLATGLAYGSIGSNVATLIGDSKTSRDVLVQGGGGLVDGFYAVAIVLLALLATGFAISSALRPRAEEADGRLESLLATGLSRRRWLASHAAVTAGGCLLELFSAGLGVSTGFGLATGTHDRMGSFLLGTLSYLAPVLVLAAVAQLLYGIVPQRATLAWLGLVIGVVVMFFGPLLKLPGWVQDVSPYHHVALVPAQPFAWMPFVVLLVVSAVLSAVGFLAFGRRGLY